MDALLMCGGRGTRLAADVEKPLFEIADRPMIDRVLTALSGSAVERVVPVVSPHVPNTRAYLADRPGVDGLVETPGDGYVADIQTALADDRVEPPVLTVVADLPLLASGLVDLGLDHYDGRDLTVLVPTALKRTLDVSADTTKSHGGHGLAATGLNIVGELDERDPTDVPVEGDERDPTDVPMRDDSGRMEHTATIVGDDGTEVLLVSYDARLAVNVNRLEDAAVAEVLADGP